MRHAARWRWVRAVVVGLGPSWSTAPLSWCRRHASSESDPNAGAFPTVAKGGQAVWSRIAGSQGRACSGSVEISSPVAVSAVLLPIILSPVTVYAAGGGRQVAAATMGGCRARPGALDGEVRSPALGRAVERVGPERGRVPDGGDGGRAVRSRIDGSQGRACSGSVEISSPAAVSPLVLAMIASPVTVYAAGGGRQVAAATMGGSRKVRSARWRGALPGLAPGGGRAYTPSHD